MAINPNDSKQITRLRRALECSRKELLPFRENCLYAIKQYVGRHYGGKGSGERVPNNLIELAINTYTRQLSAQNPRVLCTTQQMGLKPKSAKFEIAINNLLREIKFEDTMRMAVVNAMFSMGIIKTGITSGGSVEIDGYTHDIGQPFADCVDLDDWVHDMSARRWDQVSFEGNKYRLPYDSVMESDLYNNTKDLKPTKKSDYYEGQAEEKAEDLSQGKGYDEDEYQDYIELWDLWLPMENLIVTLPCGIGDPIRTVEWDGPEDGPFKKLSYSDVPNNIMPLPPVAVWVDLHEMGNRIWRKLAQQAERQKTILGVLRGKGEDGSRIVAANDGDAIAMDDPNSAKEYRYGGIDQQSLGFGMQVDQKFSRHAGNLDVVAGLSPQADTLGQEELLSKSSSKRMIDMQGRTTSFAKNVCYDLGWYLWHDKFITLPMFKRIESVGIDIPMKFTPEDREGDFYQYNIDIEPYSMQDKSPQAHLASIKGFMAEIIAPLAPQLQQAGMAVNWESLVRLYAKYSSMPELGEILTFAQPQMAPEASPGAPAGAPGKPATTTRNYVRTSRPGASQDGQSNVMSSLMFGGNPQPSERNMLGRSVA